MERRRCEKCGQVIQASTVTDPQTEYCAHRSKRSGRHNTLRAMPVSNDEFDSVVKARTDTLGELAAESDALLARMQTRKARRGTKAAFNASPAELGRAALEAARKRR